jgi:Holliday junction resolvase RusA-like endonuclease
MNTLTFRVHGLPQTQGSKTPFAIRRKVAGAWQYTGKVAMVEGRRPASRQAFQTWRQAVQLAATDARHAHGWRTADEPLAIGLTFYLPPPKVRRFEQPATDLDLDKLVRAIFDALTDAGVCCNDNRFCDVAAAKRYATDAQPAGVFVAINRRPEKTLLTE